MQNKRKNQQDAVDVLLKLSSVVSDAALAPPAEKEQLCDNKPRMEKFTRLEKECNDLREENYRLKDVIISGIFDERAFEKDDEKVKMTGIPTYSKLQVVLTFVISADWYKPLALTTSVVNSYEAENKPFGTMFCLPVVLAGHGTDNYD